MGENQLVKIWLNFNLEKNHLDSQFNFPAFDKSDPGEEYVETLIREGYDVPLVDLPDDAPLPDYYDAELFKRCVIIIHGRMKLA